jgi:magnesium chelatase family protein
LSIYEAPLSGPLLDRIDLHIEVPAVTAANLVPPPPAGGSRKVAGRVARARAMQAERYAALGTPDVRTSAASQGALLDEIVKLENAPLALIHDAADAMRLAARGYHRVLRVARTLANLDGSGNVGRVHLAEPLSYRVREGRREDRVGSPAAAYCV